MSKILFLIKPANGHVNPTLGLVDALVKQGEQVIYFCSEEYRDRIETSGAVFKNCGDNKFSGKSNSNPFINHINEVLNDEILQNILEQIKGIKFDYIVQSSMFPLGNIVSQILKIPTISSFEVFATAKDLASEFGQLNNNLVIDYYKEISNKLEVKYDIKMPTEVIDLFFSKGDLNIAYTSKYFISHPEYYDDSFVFIGPPTYDRKEKIDFPFEKLRNRKVIYISLGTVFNDTDDKLYDIFFKSFMNDDDVVVVMTAYDLDISKFDLPKNFIVKNYVPQSEILKYTDVAITHAGMNSINDLVYNNVPFVAIPIYADQPYMAARVSELGAAISLDKDNITSEILKRSVDEVVTEPKYLENIKKISDSFKATGGYKKAIEEI